MDLERYREGRKYGRMCLVGRTLRTLDKDRSGILRQLLEDPDVLWSNLERYSEEDFGVRIPAQTASRHARGVCSCD